MIYGKLWSRGEHIITEIIHIRMRNKCAYRQSSYLICKEVISYWKLTEVDESYLKRVPYGHRTTTEGQEGTNP